MSVLRAGRHGDRLGRMDTRTFVIVGASLAGAKAAETLREEGFEGRVVLIGSEEELPYERPPLSKGYLLGNDPRESAQVHPADWYAEHNVELMLGRTVTALEVAVHRVVVDDGSALAYDKLLLATGSRLRRLEAAGAENSGIHYLRTLPDSDALKEALRPGRQVVVVGGGWIGLETAAAARHHGCDVTIVELEPLPLQKVLGDEIAAVYRDLHVANGVGFHFGSGVREFGGLGGRLTDVVLQDGTEIGADVAIVGVGITPIVDLARAAGLAVENGVAVDQFLRTTDPDVYACGDVAAWQSNLVGARIRVEHWANALNGGPAAAKVMLGGSQPYDPVPYFYSDQYDLSMEYAGYVPPRAYDEVVVRGSAAVGGVTAAEFVAFWLRDGRVLAGMNANVWDVQDDIQKLVRAGYAGSRVDKARLADASVPLSELTAAVGAAG
jgi:3-phenylpropionate/trans-cinnamate dioxygenase ferredoxin reductase component